MSQSFDAYHIWLGIPAEEQPPHLYRLLGLDPLESNANAIANAVDLRQRHLQSCAAGPKRDRAQTLLAEIHAAGQVLLNDRTKLEYDQQLRTHLGAASRPVARPMPVASPTMKSESAVRRHAPGHAWAPVAVAVGAAVLLMLGMAVAAIGWGLSRKRERSAVASRPKQEMTPVKQQNEPDWPLDDKSGIASKVKAADDSPSEPVVVVANTKPMVTASKVRKGPPKKVKRKGKRRKQKPKAKPVQVAAPISAPAPSTSLLAPLEQLPDPLALPSLLVHEPRDLGSLGSSDADYELQLIGDFAKLPDGARFVSRAVPGSEGRWRVFATGDEKVIGTPIAEFAALSGTLKFVWLEGGPVEVAQQLQNGLLRIATGEHFRELPLRGPQAEGPFVVSLAKANDVRVLELNHVPDRENTYLEIEPLENFPVPANFKDGERLAKIGKTVAIELSERPGAEIRVKLDKKGRDGMAIVVSPVYNPNAAIDFDLSVDRLQKMKSGTQKAIVSSQKDLLKRKNLYENLKSQYKLVSRRSASNAGQRAARQTALNEISKRVAAANKKVVMLEQKIPQLQARLKALPEAEELVGKIHEKAELRLRVFAVDENEYELTLYSAGLGASQ